MTEKKHRRYRNTQCPKCRFRDCDRNGCTAGAKRVFEIATFRGITDEKCEDFKNKNMEVRSCE